MPNKQRIALFEMRLPLWAYMVLHPIAVFETMFSVVVISGIRALWRRYRMMTANPAEVAGLNFHKIVEDWHSWFAWHPVWLSSGKRVCFRRLQRRIIIVGGSLSPMHKVREYRAP